MTHGMPDHRLRELHSMATFQRNSDALELITEIKRLRAELELSNRYLDRRNERIIRDSHTIAEMQKASQT
jgi:hypothetical protein